MEIVSPEFQHGLAFHPVGTLEQVTLSQPRFLSSVDSFNGSEEIGALVSTGSFFSLTSNPFCLWVLLRYAVLLSESLVSGLVCLVRVEESGFPVVLSCAI